MVKSQENDGPAVTLAKLPILANAAEVSSRCGSWSCRSIGSHHLAHRADVPGRLTDMGLRSKARLPKTTELQTDRLARSLRQLLTTVDALKSRGIGLRSLHENIDTTSATGRLILHIFAALGQFEVELLRERN